MTQLDATTEAALRLSGAASFRVDAAVCLGSGLGPGADAVSPDIEIPYAEIPLLGRCSVPGHAGFLRLGRADGLNVAVFSGRRHYYEAGDMRVAAGTARIAARLGARFYLALSAVGGVDPALAVGTWAFVDDHVNLMGQNPLLGVSGQGGPPFLDLSNVYRKSLYSAARIALPDAVATTRATLAAFSGPTYETPAEVRMARLLGAGVVGMSTVPEAVWARYLGMEVAAWGLVANPAAGVSASPLDHADVLGAAREASSDAPLVVAATLAAWVKEERGG